MKIHYFVLEPYFNKIRNKHNEVLYHDFTSDIIDWNQKLNREFSSILSSLNENCVIVIDSLVHLLYRDGIDKVYQVLNDVLKNKTGLFH